VSNKICSRCGLNKPLEEFRKWRTYCRACESKYSQSHRDINPEYRKEWRHKRGECLPIAESRDSSSFLGVFVAERALSKFFDHIERMPYGNPGFDFICGKGYKIDVKSACKLSKPIHSDFWHFNIKHNKEADFFLCLAFDNRASLEPLHVWLIPGKILNHLHGFVIPESRLYKWSQYEKPLDKVIACCQALRT
jgi:hypothetical protein